MQGARGPYDISNGWDVWSSCWTFMLQWFQRGFSERYLYGIDCMYSLRIEFGLLPCGPRYTRLPSSFWIPLYHTYYRTYFYDLPTKITCKGHRTLWVKHCTALVLAHVSGKKELTEDNEDFFQEAFEIGRRYKIMNPEKMRSIYGKLMYMVQDAVEPRMQRSIRVNCMRPIRTVGSVLRDRGLVDAMLDDDDFIAATAQPQSASVPAEEVAWFLRAVVLRARCSSPSW